MSDRNEILKQRMRILHIEEKDLIENFILGSGSGGQKINKTASCVQLKHVPSGIEIKCQRSRSREQNRFLAREELCKRVERRLESERREKQAIREKQKRKNRQASALQKAKRLANKKHLAGKKRLRGKPRID